MKPNPIPAVEAFTILTMLGCYLLFAVATVWLPQISVLLAIGVTTFAIALHSSLQHEALHGHPTRIAWINELLVLPAVGLFVPYRRFRALHLAHHHDEILTDPYDDPESNFTDPAIWAKTPGWKQALLRLNNTLLGRILIGPGLSTHVLLRSDIGLIARGDRSVLIGWVMHALGLLPVIWWASSIATLPVWAYVLSAYLGYGLLKIRTYLEHRAHDAPSSRTVIVEDRGPLAFLFLNNNYHIVHHSHPGEPWYRMQALYYADPERYRRMNGGYVYRNYAEIFRKHFLWAKDPVPHPLMKAR